MIDKLLNVNSLCSYIEILVKKDLKYLLLIKPSYLIGSLIVSVILSDYQNSLRRKK